MLPKTHCVSTRFVSPKGRVIRHVYGPYTHTYARGVRHTMLADAAAYGYELEASVCKLLNDDADKETS